MLEALEFENVGPAPELGLEFKPRMNFLVGDNGLGKSFLLDVAWWALTRTWARTRVVPHRPPATSTISFRYSTGASCYEAASSFDREHDRWMLDDDRPGIPGLVLYAQVDGGFSVWDPVRNSWRDLPELPAAFRFSAREVWEGNDWCEGLIRDWGSWQREAGKSFAALCRVLEALSPSPEEQLTPGELRRIAIGNPKSYPTLKMPYGQDVAVIHASAGMRRIIALAYLLVWTWQEHLAASELRGSAPAREIVFLIDEVESHLHPQWQRRIVPAMLEVMEVLTGTHETAVQLIVATHSPLVLASTESYFMPENDAIWALDLVQGEVRLEATPWRRRGDANTWLSSPIFDLGEPRSIESERALEAARQLIRRARIERPPSPVDEMVAEHEEWEAKQERERAETHEQNLAVLNEHIEAIRSGKHQNLLYWLVRYSHENPSSYTSSLEKARTDFGDEITDAAAAGLVASWRGYSPEYAFEQEQRNTTPYYVLTGLTGLALEFGEGVENAQLSNADVKVATRLATRELNGFPPWFAELASGWPKIVTQTLLPALEADLVLEDPEARPEILSRAWAIPEVLRAPLAFAVLNGLETRPPTHLQVLEDALRICRWLEGAARERLPRLTAKRLTQSAPDEAAVIWWCSWVTINPGDAVGYLEEQTATLESSELDRFVEGISAKLGERRFDDIDAGRLTNDTDALERLIPIVYASVRPSDDVDRLDGRVHVVTPRDHAERFRGSLVRMLTSLGTAAAVEALDRLAEHPNLKDLRSWLLQEAEAAARLHSARPMDTAEAIRWSRSIRAGAHDEALALPRPQRASSAQKEDERVQRSLARVERRFGQHSAEPDTWWRRTLQRRSWAEVLEYNPVLLWGADEQLGLQRRAADRRNSGEAAFFMKVSELSRYGTDGLVADDQARLDDWRHDTGHALFLLEGPIDNDDGQDSLIRALTNLREYAGTAQTRMRLVVSSPGTRTRKSDLRDIINRFFQKTATQSRGSEDHLDSGDGPLTLEPMRVTETEAPKGSIEEYDWLPFSEAELPQCLELYGVEDVAKFVAELELIGAVELIRSSHDVGVCVRAWQSSTERLALGALTEQVLSARLERGRRRSRHTLPWEVMSAALARLASISAVSSRPSLSIAGETDDALPLKAIFYEWSDDQLVDFCSREVFQRTGDTLAVYSVRAREYLAAKWLRAALDDSQAKSSIISLLFGKVTTHSTLAGHLASVATWLAHWDEDIFEYMLEASPETLMTHGDPGSLPIASRERVLDARVSKLQRRPQGFEPVSRTGLHRFAPGLDDAARKQFTRDDLTPSAVDFLLELVAQGPLRSCADEAVRWATDPSAHEHIRCAAIRAVSETLDDPQKQAFIHKRLSALESWGQDEAGCLAYEFFPAVMSVQNVAELLRRVEPGSPASITSIKSFVWHGLPARCPSEDRLTMLTELARLVEEVERDRGWLVDGLHELCRLVVDSLDVAEEPVSAFYEALEVIRRTDDTQQMSRRERGNLKQAIAEKPRVRRWLFWRAVADFDDKQGHFPESHFQLWFSNQLSTIDLADAGWLAHDARTHDAPEARELAFRELLFLSEGPGREDEGLAKLVEKLLKSDRALEAIARRRAEKRPVTLDEVKTVDAQLRAALGDTDPFLTRWRTFVENFEERA
jgi:hypothetical protein